MKLLCACALSLLVSATCKSKDKGGEADTPEPRPTETKKEAPETPPDAAADDEGSDSAFTARGIGALEIGSDLDEDAVSKAAGGAEVEKVQETAEGEVVGVMFHAKRDGALLFTARPGDDGMLGSIEFRSGFKGPEGIEPGVTKYEAARDSVGVTDCTGGAEDHAEEILCDTETAGMRIAFADPEAKHMATPIPADKQDQILGGRVVEWVLISGGE